MEKILNIKKDEYIQIKGEINLYRGCGFNLIRQEGSSVAIGKIVDVGNGYVIQRDFYSFKMTSRLFDYSEITKL